jgi:hypothetical protein
MGSDATIYLPSFAMIGSGIQISLVFFVSFFGWGETESTWYVGHCWPIVPAPDDRWWLWSSRWNENWQGKPKYSEETCPSATLSTTNPTSPDLLSNPGHRGGKPTTNRLSYGTAPGIQVILRLWPQQLRGCSVGITDGRDLWSIP